jgi:two-component system sensor histidine kinase PilS (NtrC family)
MMIGRREVAVSESFVLRGWLEKFQNELRERHALDETALVSEWQDRDLTVRMDKSQLHQVLWNLCENALRYSLREPRLCFVCGIQRENARPFIDIIDTGPGMTDEVAEQIFEPFFTGERTGTGLGLYIARELCEANQAALTLQSHGASGCRFRILFAHPDRQQLSA